MSLPVHGVECLAPSNTHLLSFTSTLFHFGDMSERGVPVPTFHTKRSTDKFAAIVEKVHHSS